MSSSHNSRDHLKLTTIASSNAVVFFPENVLSQASSAAIAEALNHLASDEHVLPTPGTVMPDEGFTKFILELATTTHAPIILIKLAELLAKVAVSDNDSIGPVPRTETMDLRFPILTLNLRYRIC